MAYELWVTARRMPDLKTVMTVMAHTLEQRLPLEHVAENFNEDNQLAVMIKSLYPGAIVTCSVVPATAGSTAPSGRDDRVLRALLLAQPCIPPGDAAARDAVELAILELTKVSPGQGSSGS